MRTTAANRAGTFSERSRATDRWAKSRQTPWRASRVRTAPSVGRLDPETYVSWSFTQAMTALSRLRPDSPANSLAAVGASESDSQYRLGRR